MAQEIREKPTDRQDVQTNPSARTEQIHRKTQQRPTENPHEIPDASESQSSSLSRSSFFVPGAMYSICAISNKIDRTFQRNVTGSETSSEDELFSHAADTVKHAARISTVHLVQRKQSEQKVKQNQSSQDKTAAPDFEESFSPDETGFWQNHTQIPTETAPMPSKTSIKTKESQQMIRTAKAVESRADKSRIRVRQKQSEAARAESVKKTAEANAKKQMAQKSMEKKAKKKTAEKSAASGVGKASGGMAALAVGILVMILLLFFAFLLLIAGKKSAEEEQQRQNATSAAASVSDAVRQYESIITQFANENGIGRYVPLIEAVMMQESGGQGVNVMQVAFTSVSSTEESIRLGVAYFRECLEMARVTSPEDIDRIKAALQGYNYGTGYITWVWRNYAGEYTPENAQLYSDMQKANLGWSIYGDPLYVEHVLRYYHAGAAGNIEYLTDGSAFAWPVPGHANITSGFGSRWGTTHKGIDISDGSIQGMPVVASRSGTVTRADNACTHNYPKNSSCGCGGGYGNRVEISHGDGTSTLYGHMVTITVSVGQTVEQGQVIGYVGSTGHSTGYHLHFEIKQNGVQVDPMAYL